MKFSKIAIAALIVASALIVVPGARAASATTLTTNNVYGNVQPNFTVDGAMFFGVYTGTSQSVTLILVNKTYNASVQTMSVTTGSSGSYQSWVKNTFNFFDLSGVGAGPYQLQAWIAGKDVANASLTISYPRYSSTVTTMSQSPSSPNRYFDPGSLIGVRVFTEDQFGNPMSGNTSAGLQITVSGMSAGGVSTYLATLSPNDYGVATFVFGSFALGYAEGKYQLFANFSGTPAGSSVNNPETGTGAYYIIKDTLAISPYSSSGIYGQGTRLNLSADLVPYPGTVNFTVESNQGKVYTNLTNLAVSGGFWNYSYLINYSLPDGYYFFNISEYSNSYLFISQELQFEALAISAYSNEPAYVPGEPAYVYYVVSNTSNDGPVSGLSVNYTLNYRTAAGHESLSGQVSGGTIKFAIPANTLAPSTATMEITASNSYRQNVSYTLPLYVEKLASFLDAGGSYYPAQIVYIQAGAQTAKVTAPVPGAKVWINVTLNGNVIGAFSAGNMTTDGQGLVSYSFILPQNITPGTYNVVAHVSAYGLSSNSTASFDVLASPGPAFSLQVIPSRGTFLSGAPFTAAWVLTENGSVAAGAHAVFAAFINNGAIATGSSSNGTIYFLIPSDVEGQLSVQVTASAGSGQQAYSTVTVGVAEAILIINPSITVYRPGDTVHFSLSILGNGFPSPVFYYEMKDASGNTVTSGTTTGTSISFTVPRYPSQSYTLSVIASNRSSGTVSNAVTVYEYSGLLLYVSLSPSSYVGGSYTPGQKVTVYFRISALDSSPSAPYAIMLQLIGVPGAVVQYTAVSGNGSVSFTLPSGMSSGSYLLYVQAYSSNGLSAVAYQTVQVSGVQPFWNYQVLPGASLGSLLLGIIAVVALALAVAPYLVRRAKKHDGGGQESSGTKKGDTPAESGTTQDHTQDQPKTMEQ